MCVDLSKLNKFVRRERYPSVTPARAVTDIQQSKAICFTVFDALKGYHQCPLDEESQKLTTFITPFGRFMYLRAPYGISSISEHYDRRMDEALREIQGIQKIVDDVVVYDQDEAQHVEHVREILRRCKEKGISLNRNKFRFCQSQAHFAGLTLATMLVGTLSMPLLTFRHLVVALIFDLSLVSPTNLPLARTNLPQFSLHYDLS